MVKTIKATSRASVKIRDSFYTFEYCEEHSVEDVPVEELTAYKEQLWETVNFEVDKQIEEVLEIMGKR